MHLGSFFSLGHIFSFLKTTLQFDKSPLWRNTLKVIGLICFCAFVLVLRIKPGASFLRSKLSSIDTHSNSESSLKTGLAQGPSNNVKEARGTWWQKEKVTLGQSWTKN